MVWVVTRWFVGGIVIAVNSEFDSFLLFVCCWGGDWKLEVGNRNIITTVKNICLNFVDVMFFLHALFSLRYFVFVLARLFYICLYFLGLGGWRTDKKQWYCLFAHILFWYFSLFLSFLWVCFLSQILLSLWWLFCYSLTLYFFNHGANNQLHWIDFFSILSLMQNTRNHHLTFIKHLHYTKQTIATVAHRFDFKSSRCSCWIWLHYLMHFFCSQFEIINYTFQRTDFITPGGTILIALSSVCIALDIATLFVFTYTTSV